MTLAFDPPRRTSAAKRRKAAAGWAAREILDLRIKVSQLEGEKIALLRRVAYAEANHRARDLRTRNAK